MFLYSYVENGITIRIYEEEIAGLTYTCHTTTDFGLPSNPDKYFYHRISGPAIIWSDGVRAWFYQNQEAEVESQAEYERWLKLKAFI